ncbi:putative Phage-like element PBSX protein XkdP [uncultured Eubacteriales bacterium]|uniref:Putative Phage-like element PBSX protein XkdP n=1 Tax=uncultured Eubacteriales bacterium TaxID=172733 RepID=A0A212J4L5_9FIRM|nr:putative Phage-like element PBSX protein XkdP [uncultured Eubacteriales bacterium]
MSYSMYLKTAAGVWLPIPVLPDKLKVTSPGKNKTDTVLGLGEVLLLRKKGLRTLAWDSHFPAHPAPYVTGGASADIPAPIELVKAIQAARDSLEPLRFLLLGTDLDVNMLVGVGDFSYDERGGEVGDIYYSIELTEWKDYSARRLVLQGGTKKVVDAPAERSGTPGPAPKSYTVAAGDSLWSVARRAYGDGAAWKQIYDANKATIGANPSLIYAGQVLTLI